MSTTEYEALQAIRGRQRQPPRVEYACPDCPRTFPSTPARDRHRERQHAPMQPDISISKATRVRSDAIRTGAACANSVCAVAALLHFLGVV